LETLTHILELVYFDTVNKDINKETSKNKDLLNMTEEIIPNVSAQVSHANCKKKVMEIVNILTSTKKCSFPTIKFFLNIQI